MMNRTKTMVAAGGVALVLAGTGAGIAAAQSSPTPPAPPSSSAPNGAAPNTPAPKAHAPGTKHDGHKGKGLLGKVEHGEFTTHTKAGDKVVDVQRGTVTDVNDKSITVTSTDGFSATYKIDATTTKVRKDKKEVPVSQIAKNDRVQLTAVKAGDTTTAQHIGDSGLPK
jgi:hypothetical protein